MRMFVLYCMLASAAAFVATPLAARRGPLALRVATALPIMNIDPADATAAEGAAEANITEVTAEPAMTREEEKLDIFSIAKKAAPVVAVAGALFVIATTLAPSPPPPAPPPPVVVAGKQKRQVDKKKPARVQAKAETAKEKEAKAKAAKKAKEAEKKAAKKDKNKKAAAKPVVAEKADPKKDKKAAKTKSSTPVVVAPADTTTGTVKAAPLLTPEVRAQRTEPYR
jgi:type IV secretory pathway VirB10-like protein